MIRYAIGNGETPADAPARTRTLAVQAKRLALEGVDFFQVREKDLPFEAAAALALKVWQAVDHTGMRVLLNAPWTAANAEAWPSGVGLHLSSASLQTLLPCAGKLANGPVSASCHSVSEAKAAAPFADMLLFAPVFEKRVDGDVVCKGAGLELLRQVVAAVQPLPVLAMGGVTLRNADACMQAGAAGIAGIRLFAHAAEQLPFF